MPDYIQVTINDVPESITVTISTDGIPPGGVTGQILVKLSSANGHVGWGSTDALPIPVEPTDITEMLGLPSGSWFRARVFNTYGAPVLSYWDKVLKSSAGGALLVANGDSILETDDGLAFAVRTSAMSQV